eukprot:3501689-Alexandrium_andersonii.AAC.1
MPPMPLRAAQGRRVACVGNPRCRWPLGGIRWEIGSPWALRAMSCCISQAAEVQEKFMADSCLRPE